VSAAQRARLVVALGIVNLILVVIGVGVGVLGGSGLVRPPPLPARLRGPGPRR